MQLGKPENMHGARTFYFTAPGGFTVEVFHQRGLSEGRSSTESLDEPLGRRAPGPATQSMDMLIRPLYVRRFTNAAET